MSTFVVQQGRLTNQPKSSPKLSCVAIVVSIIFIFGTPLAKSEKLPAGTWTGNYTLKDGTQLETRYVIDLAQEDEDKVYKIKMYILDIERESPYKLKNISLQEKKLTFTKENETAEITTCQLGKNEREEYHGTCQSSLDQEGSKLAKISMIPPKEE